MKTEDIDKRIGMPDVNAEWTKFEREVIGNSPAGGKPKAKQKSMWINLNRSLEKFAFILSWNRAKSAYCVSIQML